MILKLLVLTSNNVVWVNFSTVLFDEIQYVVKTSMVGCVPVHCDVIKIETLDFLAFYIICKLKGLYLTVTIESLQ